jgi:LacI family transcriptional regulator
MIPDRPRRPTLSDVARLAGVSLGSASRVMSEPEAVRQRTREAVEAAAEQLGYVPNGNARALAMRRSMMVGVVLPTITNPVFASFVHVLQRRLGAEGYHLLVQAHEYDHQAEVALVERLIRRGIDGLVLVGTDHDPAVTALLARSGLPHLFSWSSDEAPAQDCVGFSNRQAMREMVQYLLDLGHRRFAILSGALAHNERARARVEGAREALAAAGIVIAPDDIVIQPFSIEGGRQGLRVIAARGERPTALVCTTDLMAAGALAEAHALGIAVPDALSITGFDDIDIASAISPPLTTIHAPIREMGERVGERMLVRLKGGAPDPSLTIPTHLVRRQSAGVVAKK